MWQYFLQLYCMYFVSLSLPFDHSTVTVTVWKLAHWSTWSGQSSVFYSDGNITFNWLSIPHALHKYHSSPLFWLWGWHQFLKDFIQGVWTLTWLFGFKVGNNWFVLGIFVNNSCTKVLKYYVQLHYNDWHYMVPNWNQETVAPYPIPI